VDINFIFFILSLIRRERGVPFVPRAWRRMTTLGVKWSIVY